MMITQAEILEHALVGYQAQRGDFQRRIGDLERRLSGAELIEAPTPAHPTNSGRPSKG